MESKKTQNSLCNFEGEEQPGGLTLRDIMTYLKLQ